MNWRRGLFRAWVAVSAAWLGPVALFGYSVMLSGSAMRASPQEPNVFDQFDPPAHTLPTQGEWLAQHWTTFASLWAVPVVLLFVVGWALIWIASGFARQQS